MKQQQNKNKKKKNGYFNKNIQENGPNFFLQKNAKEIKYDFRNIIKDISNLDLSSIRDISNIVNCFMNLTFSYNVYNTAYEEYSLYNAMFIGLQQYLFTNANIDPNAKLEENMRIAQHKRDAYFVIIQQLSNIIHLFNISVDDDWMKVNLENIIKTLAVQLSPYKRII